MQNINNNYININQYVSENNTKSESLIMLKKAYEIGENIMIKNSNNPNEDLQKLLVKYKYNLRILIDLYIGLLYGLINSIECSNLELTFPLILPVSSTNPSFSLILTLLKKLGISYKYTKEKPLQIHNEFQDQSQSTNTSPHYIQVQIDDYCEMGKYEFTILPKGIGNYYGFELDGNGRFILLDRIITHNTVMGLKIAEELKVKTLILVHKEFLMNQWVERIKEYLPDARIGYIEKILFWQ